MTDLALEQTEITKPYLIRTESDDLAPEPIPSAPHASWPSRWLALMVFILLATPKMRVMIGPAPLYIIDLLIFFLLLAANGKAAPKCSSSSPLSLLVPFYLMFVHIGEWHGFLIYGSLLESFYMVGEFTLGISMFFIVPRLLRDTEAMASVLKAIVLGLLCTSVITVMYSFGPTRSLVMDTILSYKFLVPSPESLARRTLAYGGMSEVMRGYSLIGTSTITTGFLGTMWAFAFMAANWPGMGRRWRAVASAASLATPFAMLMTYGRAAWLTVIVIGIMSLLFGFAKSRRNVLLLLLGLAMIVVEVGWESEWFMVDRVVRKTRYTLETPLEEESFAQRLTSYTQPFSHLSENPIWLVAGAGRVGQKLSARGDLEATLYEAAGLSKHSGFGMAYYCYGLVAAIIHVLIMLNGLRLILRRLRSEPPEGMPLHKIIWRTFLMAWCGLFLWWLPGHAMIGEARGVVLFFFLYGLMMSCERILPDQTNEGFRQ